MQPAADRLKDELASVEFGTAQVPVPANVTGRPVREPREIPELLARQVVSPVRWAQSMHWCAEQGAAEFLEVGPGRVLQGLLRRVNDALNCRTVADAEQVRQAAEAL